jgi:alkylation response protein AidB-like acyl-CoA dehydrogenase
MTTYTPPLRDFRFVLEELWDVGELAKLPGYEEATPETIATVLEEGGKLCSEVLFPLNRSGDEEGCHYENGVVRTPKGFKEAYRAYIEGGWTGLDADPEWGGQGLPHTVSFCLSEMMCSANLSFAMYPGLSHGAYNALEKHGTKELQSRYLPKLVEGTWSGTMCLTEPQCGTDLGQIRTRAEPNGDGSYKITGTKIFISAGEHDLTENILHLVLARLPDAPAGIKGISLFLVPKFVPTADGKPGPGNGVRCGGIEHKMGIKASSTCVMNFEEAEGWLVGEKHKGMRCMFTMMNAARLGVGIQGVGLAETAYQSARAYASERLQGRSLKGAEEPEKPADPIIVHPDVRRMLLTMKSMTEGARALAVWVGMELDIAARHPDPARREEAEDFIALLTPVVKALFTDIGSEASNLGVQVMGGHGFIREHGMEQLVRDARITQLYEGTNGIQALDLVGRKLGQNTGRLLRRFFHPLDAYLAEKKSDAAMKEFVEPLGKAFGRLQQATVAVAQAGLRDPEAAGAAATDYLRLFGLVALAWMWARMAEKALPNLAGDEAWFYKGKLATARFYMARILPQSSALLSTILVGPKSLMELEAEGF